MMFIPLAWIAVVVLFTSAVVLAETIDFTRVHIVDHVVAPTGKSALLVRGNAPLECFSKNNCTFAYNLVMEYVRRRAANASISLPANDSKIYLLDITFEGVLDSGFFAEADYWADPQNAAKGAYMQWELFGAPIWASELPNSTVQRMLENPSTEIWEIDQLPTRLDIMRSGILASGPKAGYDALVVYVHCAGGCDRTGEFVGSYRMAFHPQPSLKPIYAMDVEECGRAPDYFASGALGWYCLEWNKYNASVEKHLPPIDDCLTAYSCSLFGSCHATGL